MITNHKGVLKTRSLPIQDLRAADEQTVIAATNLDTWQCQTNTGHISMGERGINVSLAIRIGVPI
jgi:hypothetical protein